MKRFLIILGVIVLVFILIAAGGVFYITRGLDEGAKLAVNPVDPSSVSDGVYHGRYASGRWTNELDVTVKDHKISGIKIIKDVAFPKPEWAQQLFDRVIEKQNTDVEVISGATVTSRAYLKSVENAFK